MRKVVIVVFALGLCLASPATALVGETGEDAGLGAHVAMLLRRANGRSSFCTAVVVSRRALLTSAHCVGAPSDMRLYAPAASGGALLEVVQATRHPGYRADAIASRRPSVDLAVIEMRDDLPEALTPVELAEAEHDTLGETFSVAGFGVTDEARANSGGRLSSLRLQLRAPLSSVLLWLVALHPPGGACEGDSGAPVFDAQNRLVGIVAYAEGAKGAHCGALTQAVRLAPWRAFLDGVLRRR